MSVLQQGDRHEAFARLSRFRGDFYDCLNGRADALFDSPTLCCARTGRSGHWSISPWRRNTAVVTVPCTAA